MAGIIIPLQTDLPRPSSPSSASTSSSVLTTTFSPPSSPPSSTTTSYSPPPPPPSSSSSSSSSFRAIIVGGGPVGLTAAHCFAAAGIDFVLLESRDTVFPEAGSSLVLNPASLRVLHQVGVATVDEDGEEEWDLLERGQRLDHMEVVNESGWRYKDTYPFEAIERCFGIGNLAYQRHDVLEILYRHLSDDSKARVHVNKRVTSLSILYDDDDPASEEEAVAVRCADGTEYTGSIVVGADGTYSRIRGMMRDMELVLRRTRDADRDGYDNGDVDGDGDDEKRDGEEGSDRTKNVSEEKIEEEEEEEGEGVNPEQPYRVQYRCLWGTVVTPSPTDGEKGGEEMKPGLVLEGRGGRGRSCQLIVGKYGTSWFFLYERLTASEEEGRNKSRAEGKGGEEEIEVNGCGADIARQGQGRESVQIEGEERGVDDEDAADFPRRRNYQHYTTVDIEAMIARFGNMPFGRGITVADIFEEDHHGDEQQQQQQMRRPRTSTPSYSSDGPSRRRKRLLNCGMGDLHEGVVPHWSGLGGKVVLVGDAAHKFTPNIGLGLNSGIQDVAVLTNRIYEVLHSRDHNQSSGGDGGGCHNKDDIKDNQEEESPQSSKHNMQQHKKGKGETLHNRLATTFSKYQSDRHPVARQCNKVSGFATRQYARSPDSWWYGWGYWALETLTALIPGADWLAMRYLVSRPVAAGPVLDMVRREEPWMGVKGWKFPMDGGMEGDSR